MRILALDTSTHTGWASNCTGRIESGVQELTLRRGESPGMRFLHFQIWLTDLVKLLNPEVVVYELAHYRGGAATELCVGLVTRVQQVAAEHGAEYRGVHTGTLKIHATGNGSAGKTEMVTAANRWYEARQGGLPHEVTDDNEADALLLLAHAEAGFPEAPAKPKKKTTRRKQPV